MTLKLYDKKLLNFMYELTKLDKFYSPYALSKKITLEGGRKVTPRTIQKWFKFLREPWEFQGKKIDKFSYYPTFFYEKLGLQRVFVFFEIRKKVSLKKLFKEIPYYDYVTWLHDLNKNKEILLVSYLIPKESLEKFKEKLRKTKILIYPFFYSTSPFKIHSPWHKVIDHNGIFHPELNDENEIERQLYGLGYYLNNLPESEMVSQIKRNLLVIPTVFEHTRENWSSLKVWQTIKEKLRKDVWLYVKKKRKQTDAVGIKKTQLSLNGLEKYALLNQIRADYLPVELNHNFFVYLILKYRNEKELLEKIKSISINSIITKNYLSKNKNEILITALVNSNSFQNILDIKDIEKIFLLKHKKSLPLILDSYKFQYHKLFDPEKCCWKKI